MKKVEVMCDQPGCNYSHRVNPDYAKQTLGRHKLFTHGIKGTSKAAIDRERKKAKLAKVNEPRNPEVKPKRTYTKKLNSGLSVTLCPVCGCNIQAVNLAINLGR